MKYIKHINEGWLDSIKPKFKSYKPTYKIISNLVEDILPKYLLSSKTLNKYIKSIKFEMYNNSETDAKECWVHVESTIPHEFGFVRKTFRVFTDNNIVYCLDNEGFNVNYPLNSEEYLSEIIELFSMKIKPYLENYFLEESGNKK